MRASIGRALSLLVLLGSVGCEDDPGATLAPNPPIAFTRYVHAVPDTSAMDWRPIDALENSPWAYAMTFRANTAYQAMGAGARKLRIFPTSEKIDITSQVVIDTTINFTANTYFTVIHVGYARPGSSPADRLWVLEDAIPATIASNQVAVRVVNAGLDLGAVDVLSGASTSGTFSSLFSNVAYGAASNYQLVPVGALALRATSAGGATTLATVLAPAGAAAANGQSAAGGSTIGGSAITAIVVPRSVSGSGAPQSFTTPTILYLVDRAPR